MPAPLAHGGPGRQPEGLRHRGPRPPLRLSGNRKSIVGKVNEYMLKDVSIDDARFGVKAIGMDGTESLVAPYVYPARKKVEYETVSRAGLLACLFIPLAYGAVHARPGTGRCVSHGIDRGADRRESRLGLQLARRAQYPGGGAAFLAGAQNHGLHRLTMARRSPTCAGRPRARP